MTVDANGNIALATDGYALAQDVASACRLFLAELYYDTAQGIPYFENILGKYPSAQYLKSQFEVTALSVPGVVTAKYFLISFINRKLIGQIQVTSVAGDSFIVTIGDELPWYSSAASPEAVDSQEGGP